MSKHIGYLIKNINDKIKSRADADLKNHNLTLSQSRVIAYLSRNGGEATQKEIEVFLDIAHPTVVGIISRMERNGYIICTADAKNRRNKLVKLTGQAVSVRSDILQRIDQHEEQMLQGLSPEDVENLKRMLTVIYQNVEQTAKGECV